jgi:membrane protein
MRVYRIARETVEAFIRHNGTTLAAAIAYYTLLSIFPLILGLLAIIGTVVSDPAAREDLVSSIAGLFPGAGDLIQTTVTEVVRGRGTAGIVATLGLIWSASGVFGAMNLALDRVWQAPTYRSLPASVGLSIALVFAVGIIFVASLALSAAVQLATQLQLPVLGFSLSDLPLLVALIGVVLPFLVTFGIFVLIYRFVPNVRLAWSCAWPGALLASILFEVAKQAFAFYLSTFAHLNSVYGPIGAVIALITWAFFAANVLILGAEFNATLDRHRN